MGGGVEKMEKEEGEGKMRGGEGMGMLVEKGRLNEVEKVVNEGCRKLGMEKKEIGGDGMVMG